MKFDSPVFLVMIAVLLIAYLLFIIWVGKIGSKHSRSMAGFSIARGAVSPWVVGVSFAATYASANLFMGVPGWAYTYGAPVLWWSLGSFGLTWLGLLLFARTFWRQAQLQGGALTLPHWLRNRYNSRTLQVVVGFLALFNIYYIIGQNVGLATLFETVLGVPYVWGVTLGVTITVAYLSVGGAYAQYISDGIQGILMSFISVLLFISLAWSIGGGWGFLGELNAQMEQIDPGLIAATAKSGPFYSGLAILSIGWLLFSFGLLPHLMNKVLSLEKESDLRAFTLSSGITLFLLASFSAFAGMAARVLVPDLDSADSAIPAYIMHTFPPVVVALLITGLLAAILSTTNSLYMGISTIIGNDLYKPIIAPLIHRDGQTTEQADRHSLLVSKGALVVVGIASLFMSLNRPDSLSLLTQFGIAAIISGVIAPIVLGYLWKPANRAGAIAATLFGSGCYIGLSLTGIQSNVFLALGISSIVGFVMMIAVSLSTARAGDSWPEYDNEASEANL
ncbi:MULTISPECIES: hypothetical protein [unclassified Marinobacter]|jgi:SSS family transporter|uniref:sodium:solute symporter family transporter n=1 Tax=unclassified Marinobacter TaxID=83889 RepID=UPI0020106516|nr:MULTISPECIES: hypothetical protein [unclassified Marinobacter]UQG55160.1 hypothetical protein MIH16_17370 [Marinobacter sp. M4C]UQG63962.1 hypothetical protein MIH17_17355 [Marinobacter sp. M2C]UQG68245.1 hypothetical protein MIH19_17370 [Marinobacter sp. M1C]